MTLSGSSINLPPTTIFTPDIQTRYADLTYLLRCLHQGNCASIVGVSNVGKSTVLRLLAQPEVLTTLQATLYPQGPIFEFLPVYIDLNFLLDKTEQGFYELILRTLILELRRRGSNPAVLSEIERLYQGIVTPGSPFAVPVHFSEAITLMAEKTPERLVLIFDEFDLAYCQLPVHVFLNLRALRDRFGSEVCYVVATGATLQEMRYDRQLSEFWELFALNTRTLWGLDDEAAAWVVRQLAQKRGVTLTPPDVTFCIDQAGGHPGLLEIVCQAIVTAHDAGGPVDYRAIRAELEGNPGVRLECDKLWDDLSEAEREVLGRIAQGRPLKPGHAPLVQSLVRKSLVDEGSNPPTIFSYLFAAYIRSRLEAGRRQGIVVDEEAGQVWRDGELLSPPLSPLEFRLLSLLYRNQGKVINKDKIVEVVYAGDYDRVDDARIERLVERLRDKIEPNPREPRFLMTLRGMGYKLTGGSR